MHKRHVMRNRPPTPDARQPGHWPRRGGVWYSVVALVCLPLTLTGCASLIAPQPPPRAVPIPAAWSQSALPHSNTAAQPATALAAWWLRFDDAKLVLLIDDALRANTSVGSARAALAQSRALQEVQSARRLPGLNLSASMQRSRAGHADSSNSFNTGLDASWEPDVFGGIHAGIEASRADTLASAASLGDIQISIAAEVALDYIQLRGLQARLAIANDNLVSQLETAQLTEWRRDAGLLTDLEVEQARASVEQNRAQIPLLQTAAALAEHSLAMLTFRAPTSLHEWLAAGNNSSSSNNSIPTAPDALVLAFPLETLRQRPDVRAAEARVSAELARVSVADAARYPHFSLNGSLGLNAARIGDLGNGASVLTSLMASAATTLFDGGAARAQVRASQAALAQAASARDAVLLTALKEVEDSLATLKNNRERLQSLLRANLAAQNATQLAQYRYRAGLIDFQVLLDTQRTALSTQDSAADARVDLAADHVRLYKALGGGWDGRDQTRLAADNATITAKELP
jgi:NodT family efflux transporter outer membrane factor (OMF) lipoprotein